MWKNREDYRKYHRERQKRLYHRWRAAGACGYCGLPTDGSALCFKHKLKNSEKAKRRYNARKQRVVGTTRQNKGNTQEEK